MKLTKLLAFTLLSALGFTAEARNITKDSKDYVVSAYVWPSCHDDSLGHKYLWQDGEGEWEVIKKGYPRFEGHQQPKQPLWGYELDNDPKVVERWIETATKYGVNNFVYDWYWFMNGPYLEGALNDGFLKAANNEKISFYIMWANHFVKKNYWNWYRYGGDESILFNPVLDEKNYRIVVDRVINQYFTKPNYLKIDGKPIFGIFSIENFLLGFDNDIEKASEALRYFEKQAKKAGFKGVHFQEMPGKGKPLSDADIAKMKDLHKKLGINSVAFYNMGKPECDYMAYGAKSIDIRDQWDKELDIPVFPTVSIGWDDTPRFPKKGAADVVRYHNTPQSFAGFLQAAKEYADSHPDQPKMIMINAWNEWVEGSYLMPDRLNGFGYLEAVRDVLDGKYDH